MPGTRQYVSQMDGVLPSSAAAPSIWYAAVATPQRKPAGRPGTAWAAISRAYAWGVTRFMVLLWWALLGAAAGGG